MEIINVCILDPIRDFHVEFKKHFSKYFGSLGYEILVNCVTNERDLNKLVKSNTTDIVIADLSLGSESFSGLLVVQELKTKYPDIFCIGMSKHEVSYRQTAQKMPTFDMFIDKTVFFGEDKIYLENISGEFLRKFKRNTHLECCQSAKWDTF